MRGKQGKRTTWMVEKNTGRRIRERRKGEKGGRDGSSSNSVNGPRPKSGKARDSISPRSLTKFTT